MKILITGGYGYIGSHLYDYLKQHTGYDIYRLSSYVDITDCKALESEFYTIEPDVIIHCAALVSTRLCNIANQYAYKVNVEGTKNIVDLCNLHDCRILYIGTTASYKPVQDLITEDTPNEPNTLYGLTKYLGELYVCEHADKYTVLKFCFCYGANDRVSGISQIISAFKDCRPVILEMNPEKYKDYMHVSDFCSAVKCIVDANDFEKQTYNISYQHPKKLSDIIGMLEKSGIKPIIYYRPEPDYMGNHVVSSMKFRRKYGWKPKRTLEEGIDECLKC